MIPRTLVQYVLESTCVRPFALSDDGGYTPMGARSRRRVRRDFGLKSDPATWSNQSRFQLNEEGMTMPFKPPVAALAAGRCSVR